MRPGESTQKADNATLQARAWVCGLGAWACVVQGGCKASQQQGSGVRAPRPSTNLSLRAPLATIELAASIVGSSNPAGAIRLYELLTEPPRELNVRASAHLIIGAYEMARGRLGAAQEQFDRGEAMVGEPGEA